MPTTIEPSALMPVPAIGDQPAGAVIRGVSVSSEKNATSRSPSTTPDGLAMVIVPEPEVFWTVWLR